MRINFVVSEFGNSFYMVHIGILLYTLTYSRAILHSIDGWSKNEYFGAVTTNGYRKRQRRTVSRSDEWHF
jgi:hypothetical protein